MNDEQLNITVGAKDEASDKLKEVNRSVKSVGDTGDDVKEKLQKAGLAIATIGAGLTAYSKSAVDSTLDYVKGVKTLSTQTGMAVDTTSKLVYALGRSGVTAGEASASLGFFSKQITEANKSSAEAAAKQADLQLKVKEAENQIKLTTESIKKNGDATGENALKLQRLNLDLAGYKAALSEATSPLAKLGIETKNADGSTRAFDQILLDVSDKFKAMPNGAEKTALAMQLFGRSGKDLIPVLNQGRDGLAAMAEQADKLGLTLTPDNVARVNDYIKAQKQLKDSQQALTVAVGTEALPMWQKLTEAQNAVVGSVLKLPEPLDKVATAVLAFGGPVLTAVGGVLSFGDSLGGVMTSFPIVGKALGALGSSFGALGGLLFSWPGLILAIVAAVALILNHFGLLKPLIDAVVRSAQQLWSQLVVNLQPAFAAIQQALAGLQPYLPALETALKYVALAIGVILVGSIIAAINVITAIVNVVAWFAAAIVDYFSNAIALVSGIINFFVQLFKGNFNALPGIAWDVVQHIIGVFYPLRSILDIVQGVINGVISFWRGLITGMLNVAGSFIGIFSNSGKALIEAFAGGVSGAFDKVKDVVNKGLSAVRKLLPFSDAKEGPLSTLTLSGRRFSETFAAGISKGAPQMEKAAREALSGVQVDGISPVIQSAASQGQQIAGANGNSTTNMFYGTIAIDTPEAANAFFDRLNANAELAAMGVPT